MKKLFNLLAIFCSCILLSALMTGCNDSDDPPGPAIVNITTADVSQTEITVTFTHNEHTVNYYIAIGPTDGLAKFEDGSMEGIKKVTERGENQKTFSNLSPDTEYMIFARGENADGIKGNTVTSRITTEKEPAGAATVTIGNAEAGDKTVTVTFLPDDNTASYSIAVGTADDLSKFEDGTLSGIENVTEKGENQKTFDGLTPNTEYTIFARGVNADGVKGETSTLQFATDKEHLLLTIEGAYGEHYTGPDWADNTDLTLYSGDNTNGYAVFLETFTPLSSGPVIVPGIYKAATDVYPDEFEFAPGMYDGTGKLRQSQYMEYVDGERTQTAITGGYYKVIAEPGGGFTVNLNVETDDNLIIATYTGEIEVDDYSW